MPEHDQRLAQAVRVLARLTRTVEQACQKSELSLPQYRLLLFIAAEAQRAGELANQAAVSRPTLTALVDGLEAKGLVTREPVSGDRRGIRLEVTQAGQEALKTTEKLLTTRVSGLVAGAEEGDRLIDGLIAVGDVLRREWEQALASAAKTPR